MLTEMASGDSGTASDSSNIGTNVGSSDGGATKSPPGPAVTEQIAAPFATATGGTAGKAI